MGSNIEESLCGCCVHFRRLLIDEMRVSFSLKCAAQGRYIKTPKKSCSYYEPETWEKFLDVSDDKTE